jgi:hypothetical protein
VGGTRTLNFSPHKPSLRYTVSFDIFRKAFFENKKEKKIPKLKKCLHFIIRYGILKE